MLVDEMFKVFDSSIPDYQGKICIPLSGGLDSRVLAGLIARRRNIDLAFNQYEEKIPDQLSYGIRNVKYARQIAEVLGIENFYTINTDEATQEDEDAVKGLPDDKKVIKSKMFTVLRKLNEIVTTSDYTFLLGHGVDSLTGIGVTPFTLHNYQNFDDLTAEKRIRYFTGIFPGTYGRFGKWDCPLWNEELIKFCLDLPLKHRFMQRLYRKMINKYFPELAVINREDMHCAINVGETKYLTYRTAYFLKKKFKG